MKEKEENKFPVCEKLNLFAKYVLVINTKNEVQFLFLHKQSFL